MTVHAVAFSPDGRYLAVGLVHCGTHYADRTKPVSACVVFEATDGFRCQACTRGVPNSSRVGIRWAPQAPLLIITHHSEAGSGSYTMDKANLLVLDASTGTVVRAIGPRNEAALQLVCKMPPWTSQMELSPSGCCLLVAFCHRLPQERQSPGNQQLCQGSLLVLDVWQDSLLVQSGFSMTIPGHNTHSLKILTGLAAWHPSSQGLVVSHSVALQTETFAEAGLAVAILPEACFVYPSGQSGFSPDGQRLAVCVLVPGPNPQAARLHNRVFRCTLTGLSLDLAHEAQLDEVVGVREAGPCCWLPCSSKMLLGIYRQPRVLDLTSFKQYPAWQTSSLLGPIHFSPSQQLVTGSSPCIQRVSDGEELWAASADSYICHSHCGMVFLPSGCGVVTVDKDGLRIITFA